MTTTGTRTTPSNLAFTDASGKFDRDEFHAHLDKRPKHSFFGAPLNQMTQEQIYRGNEEYREAIQKQQALQID